VVAIRGLLSQHSIDVPDDVMLGICAVDDVLHGVFHIRNTRSVGAQSQFIYEKCLSFLPRRGKAQRGIVYNFVCL